METHQPKDSPQFLNPDTIFTFFDIAEGMTIADFGTGSGHIAFKAAELVGRKGTIYALDIKKTVIAHLEHEIKQRGLHQVKPIWTNLEMVSYNPIKQSSVDIVLIINMLYQSTKYKEVFQEAYRVLKTGGLVVVIDWGKYHVPFGPPLDERVDIERLKQIVYAIEFNTQKEFKPGPYHFGIVFRK